MKISFVIPCRNNLRYFRWAYNSIRKNQGDHEVFICAADDASTDGTREAFEALHEIDSHFDYIVNEGPERVGHTILYDRIINELVKTDIAIIFHADMYLCPGALDEIELLMLHGSKLDAKVRPQYKTIVSLTRIEPPLHLPGVEKETYEWGREPSEFDENKFLSWYAEEFKPKRTEPSNGIFAPWAFFVKDFNEVGGHDPLFKPQSKEDSCLFNRFKLNNCTFIQTFKGHVYHLTCRGSRFNPTLTTPGKNSSEWEVHNLKSTRNFIRKWGSIVLHDEYLHPIIKHKYNIGLKIKNCRRDLLYHLEPYFATLYVDCNYTDYIDQEQKNTIYNLTERIKNINSIMNNDIIIEVDSTKLTNHEYAFLFDISSHIDQLKTIGTYVYLNLKVTVNKLKTYELDLIDPSYNKQINRIF